jgi:hypothetical protein
VLAISRLLTMPRTRRQADRKEENRSATLVAALVSITQAITALNARMDRMEATASETVRLSTVVVPPAIATRHTMPPPDARTYHGQPVSHSPAVTIQRFANDANLHPMDFLRQTERYATSFNITDSEHLIDIAVSHLDDGPRDCATALSDTWGSWDDFRRDFMAMYWSLARQDAIIAEFSNTMYNKASNSTMAKFLIHWMGQMKHLTPPMEPARFLRQFMYLLPANVFNILTASNVSTTTELLQILQRMDEGAIRRGLRQVAVDTAHRQVTRQQGQGSQSNTHSSRMANGENRPNNNSNNNNNNKNNNWRVKSNDKTLARLYQLPAQDANKDLDASVTTVGRKTPHKEAVISDVRVQAASVFKPKFSVDKVVTFLGQSVSPEGTTNKAPKLTFPPLSDFRKDAKSVVHDKIADAFGQVTTALPEVVMLHRPLSGSKTQLETDRLAVKICANFFPFDEKGKQYCSQQCDTAPEKEQSRWCALQHEMWNPNRANG